MGRIFIASFTSLQWTLWFVICANVLLSGTRVEPLAEFTDVVPILFGPQEGALVNQSDVASFDWFPLYSKRYISDMYCTNPVALNEMVCTGVCIPTITMPSYQYYYRMGKNPLGEKAAQYKVVRSGTSTTRVNLECSDGGSRAYLVRLTRNCACERVYGKHIFKKMTRVMGDVRSQRRGPKDDYFNHVVDLS